jgi:hypothetical protein
VLLPSSLIVVTVTVPSGAFAATVFPSALFVMTEPSMADPRTTHNIEVGVEVGFLVTSLVGA